jgi:hypothetical protein
MHFLKTTVLTLGAVVLLAAPAKAAGTATPVCTPSGALSKTFLPFGDAGLYTPVANAGLENGSAGWTLTGGAAVVGGNDPWFVTGNSSDSHALNLPMGATATTATFCVDKTYTHIRLLARNTGLLTSSQLKVEILSYSGGKWTAAKGFTQKSETTNWVVSESVPIQVLAKAAPDATIPIAFRFSVVGLHAGFQIDDVYVDPWARS